MQRGLALRAAACLAAISACTPNAPPPNGNAGPSAVMVDQGASWNAATRADFYTRDQGSQIMPLVWIAALEQPSGAAVPGRQPRPLRLPAQRGECERPAGRLHVGRAGGQRDRRDDLRRLPHAADRGRRHRLSHRRWPGDRRFPEFPRRPRHGRGHRPCDRRRPSTPSPPRCWAARRPPTIGPLYARRSSSGTCATTR